MVRTIKLDCAHIDEYINTLIEKPIDDSAYDELISAEDVDVLKPDGSPLLMFRHKALPPGVCTKAYPALLKAAKQSNNRGAAAGGWEYRVKNDGTISNTNHAIPAKSGVIGYFDRTARFPYCRTTEYTAENVKGWNAALPFIRAVNEVFARACPERYEIQKRIAERTRPEYVIEDTAFTTVTVNRNFRTAVHKDAGDLPEGFGVMSVIQAGEYAGGYLVFPKYRIAVDMRTRDVLLADVHEFHGNAPIVGTPGEFNRIACVFYYRTKMIHCKSPVEELELVRNRKQGDPLHGSG